MVTVLDSGVIMDATGMMSLENAFPTISQTSNKEVWNQEMLVVWKDFWVKDKFQLMTTKFSCFKLYRKDENLIVDCSFLMGMQEELFLVIHVQSSYHKQDEHLCSDWGNVTTLRFIFDSRVKWAGEV